MAKVTKRNQMQTVEIGSFNADGTENLDSAGNSVLPVTISSGTEYPAQTTGVAGTSASSVATFDTTGKVELQVELSVTVEVLTGLEIWGRINSGQAYKQLYALAGDFTGAKGLILVSMKHTTATMILAADSDITTLTLAQTGTLIFNCASFENIAIYAKSAAGTAVVAAEGLAL